LQDVFSQDRWRDLADLYVKTHDTLLSVPATPLLHIALSAGLSALKTPSCHSHNPEDSIPSVSQMSNTVCPICSTELNELARPVPYALHTTSHVDPETVMLPNDRVYGLRRLKEFGHKAGVPSGRVKCLTTGEVYHDDDLKKVFIL
jgi:macrophage erythroblast attacher